MSIELGKVGVWRHLSGLTPDLVAEAEALGYGAIWVGGSPDGDLTILYAEIPRRQAKNLIQEVVAVDDKCFCIINNVNVAQSTARRSLSRRPQKVDLLSMKRGI